MEQALPSSLSEQSVAVVGALIQAVYTDSSECGRTSITNLVNGAERSDNSCIEYLSQLHR